MMSTKILLITAILWGLILGLSVPALADNDPEYITASDRLVEAADIARANETPYEALKLYEQAIVANPKNSNAYIGLGHVHEALGSLSSGIRYFETALALNPADLDALEALALVQIKAGQMEDAENTRSRIQRICGDCASLERVTDALSGDAGEDGA